MLVELAALRGLAKAGGAIVWLVALGWALKRLVGFLRRRSAAVFLYVGLYLLFLAPGYFLWYFVAAGSFPTVGQSGLPDLGYGQFLLMLSSLVAPYALALAFTRKKWLAVLAAAATVFGLVWMLWMAFAVPVASATDEISPRGAGEILLWALPSMTALLHLLVVVLGVGVIKTSPIYDVKTTKDFGWRGLFRHIKESKLGTQGGEEGSKAISAAAEKFGDVRAQVGEAARQGVGQASELANDAVESLRKAGEQASEAAQRGAGQVSEVAGDAVESLRKAGAQAGEAAQVGRRKVSDAWDKFRDSFSSAVKKQRGGAEKEKNSDGRQG